MTTKQLKLGDAIAKIAKVLHIPHCKECEERRLILNEIRSAGLRETVRRLKAVGFSHSGGKTASRSVKDVLKQLEDCCNK